MYRSYPISFLIFTNAAKLMSGALALDRVTHLLPNPDNLTLMNRISKFTKLFFARKAQKIISYLLKVTGKRDKCVNEIIFCQKSARNNF